MDALSTALLQRMSMEQKVEALLASYGLPMRVTLHPGENHPFDKHKCEVQVIDYSSHSGDPAVILRTRSNHNTGDPLHQQLAAALEDMGLNRKSHSFGLIENKLGTTVEEANLKIDALLEARGHQLAQEEASRTGFAASFAQPSGHARRTSTNDRPSARQP